MFKYLYSGSFFSSGSLYAYFFGITYALALSVLFGVFSSKFNKFGTVFAFFIIGFLYASQLVYYKIFRTFYIVYSVQNSGQIFEFADHIYHSIAENAMDVIILFMPFIVFIIFIKVFDFKIRRHFKTLSVLTLLSISIYLGVIALIDSERHNELSAYNVNYHINSPTFSVDQLGLMTFMRLDLTRQLTDWSPKLIMETLDELNVPNKANESENSYNVIDIDFNALIQTETDEEVKALHSYFKDQIPSKINEYTGLYKGYNLILITAESFSHLAIDRQLTPTLYKMVQEGYQFENFYTPIWDVSTSDGEYVATNSLIPKSGVWSFKISSSNYLPFALGNQL